jgi:MGT family glycosyltransferase
VAFSGSKLSTGLFSFSESEMRKVIILNFPTHGCINSLLATVSELANRGEQVIYYCTGEFRNKIEKTGAEFRPYQGLLNEFSIKDYDIFKLLKFQIEVTVDILENNLDAIRKEDADYIIHDSLCVWGKQIASILKLPAVNLMHSFPIVSSSDLIAFDNTSILLRVGLYKIMEWVGKSSLKKALKKKYHIDVSIGDTFINKEDLNIVYTSRHMRPTIDQKKKAFYFVGPSLFFKDEQGDFPFDRLEGRRVIYISLGTLHNDNLRFYKICLSAFSNKKYDIVMSIGFAINPQELIDEPENFTIRQSVPQQKLLEKVDLFITHAGMNSVNEAICSGVPMLLFPHQFEQKLIGQRVSEMGIGMVLNIKNTTPAKLYENAETLISDPKYKRLASKFQSMFMAEEKTSHVKAADKIFNYISDRYI